MENVGAYIVIFFFVYNIFSFALGSSLEPLCHTKQNVLINIFLLTHPRKMSD